MAERVLVILGHPAGDSLCASLGKAYVQGAQSAGREVRWLEVGSLDFDPILHHGYRQVQPLEPDLLQAQESITWANHIVLVYPTWWGGMPAILKGFFDRVFLPGFAYQYRKNSPFWDKLLKGKTTQLLVTMDTPPWYYRLINRAPGHNQTRRTILEFTGIKVKKITTFSPVRYADDAKKANWLAKAQRLGRNG